MRDPERIPKVLSEVEKVWREYPDFRLGQLLTNSVDWPNGTLDLFYIEDDRLVSLLEEKFGN
jgi:hypothetical protein